MKNAIQTALDRVYYRDRYDYRRALVGFARDLNSDLDLLRLSERLVQRVTETLVVDRMALMLAPAAAGSRRRVRHDRAQRVRRPAADAAARSSDIGAPADRRATRSRSTIRSPQRRVDARGGRILARSRDPLLRAVRLEGRDDCGAWRWAGRQATEPLSSEDMALLAAVAAQAATALENGRLYRQLRNKADELDRMREFSENILESLNDGLAVVDRDDRVVRWNRRLEELYGIRHEEAVGRRLDEMFERAVRRGAARRAARVPGRRRRLSGAAGDASRAAAAAARQRRHDAAARLATEAIAGTIVIIEDISARVQLEEQLQISEKMASIGLLAAGVAHEVNTPLTGISSFTQMLLEGAEPDDPKTQVLEKIERQTFRAAKIVNGLLNLCAARRRSTAAAVDVNVVVNDVLSLLEHQFGTGRIQVRKELAREPPLVQGVEYKLQQVFLNLFLNARDAMPKGGWLTIVDAGRAAAARSIEVADTGSGIPAEQLVAHLRSVLHDEGDRQGDRPRACRSPTASCRSTAARSPATARSGRARASRCRCRWRRPARQRARR